MIRNREKKTETLSDQLEQLRAVEVRERKHAREAQLAAEQARADVAQRREARVEAVAAGGGTEQASKLHREAQERADELAITSEGANRRAERAGTRRAKFEADNAEALIAELGDRAKRAVDRLETAKADLVAGDLEWKQVAQRVGELLAAIPGSNARLDSPIGHGLESVVHELRRHDGMIVSPLPHWRGRRQQQAAEQAALQVRLQRDGKPEDVRAA